MSTQAASLADLPWWQVFGDPALQRLIGAALDSNYDLRRAVARVEQARWLAGQARAGYFPQASYVADLERARNAFHGAPAPQEGRTGDPVQVAATALWELDFWGRVRRLNESARAQWLATEEARRGVQLSLVGDVAQAYFELLALDQQLAIARRATNSFGESLTIFTQRLERGAASGLERARAAAALAGVAATVPSLERQLALKESQLSVLLGRNPGPVARGIGLAQQAAPLEVPAGLPSDLLRRRPDLREAEQRLRAANAQIGVAAANFFPKFELTALYGRVSADLESFNDDTSEAWSVGGTAAGPLFEGGALKAQLRQAVAARDEAALAYEQAVRSAFLEVADALTARAKLEEICALQALAVTAYQESVALSLERYKAGKASYYEVLEAQQQLFPAENALAQAQLDRLSTVIRIYKALGGGWNLPDNARPPP